MVWMLNRIGFHCGRWDKILSIHYYRLHIVTPKKAQNQSMKPLFGLGQELRLEKLGYIKVLVVESKIRGFMVRFMVSSPHSIMLYLLNSNRNKKIPKQTHSWPIQPLGTLLC